MCLLADSQSAILAIKQSNQDTLFFCSSTTFEYTSSTAILDLYSDYLISSFGQTTATGLARLLGGSVSHDQITRFLAKTDYTSRELWQLVKPKVRQIESAKEGILIFDDTIVEKTPLSRRHILMKTTSSVGTTTTAKGAISKVFQS